MLAFIQKLVASDKTVLVAVLVQAAVALAAALGLHVDAAGVGILSSIVAAGIGYFLDLHFKAKLAAAAAAK